MCMSRIRLRPALLAPGQAIVHVLKAEFLVLERLVVVLEEGIVEGQAHVVHAPGGDLLDVLAGDEAVEMVLGIALEVAGVLG